MFIIPVIIFYIKINSIVLLFFQAYVEKFTSPVNSFQLFDRHLQASKVRGNNKEIKKFY